MKNSVELPSFWFRKPDQIDATIIQEFPYVVEINRQNLKHHNEIVYEIINSDLINKCTWRAATFYFKNESDSVIFKLRWG